MNDVLPIESAKTRGRVLIYAAGAGLLQEISEEIAGFGFQVHKTGCVELALDALSRESFEACLLDIDASDALEQIVAHLQSSQLLTQLVGLVSDSSLKRRAVASSAEIEMLDKPYTSQQLKTAVSRAVQRAGLVEENQRLKQQLCNHTLREMAGTSPAVVALGDQVRRVAEDQLPVLVQGEPGTGSATVGRAIHALSHHMRGPLIHADCSLHSTDGLRLELFGQSNFEGGARPGRFELARGGTLLLENIDATAQGLQNELLTYLLGRTSSPAANDENRRLHVRIVATTQVNLASYVEQSRFSKDLYEYLSCHVISTPPLRARSEDVGLLAEQTLARLVIEEGRPAKQLSRDALLLLENHNWPGNLFELNNVIESACALEKGTELTAEILRPWLAGPANDETTGPPSITLKDMERKLIEATFARCGGNRERTARILKIGLRTLSGKLREYGYPPRGGPGSNRKETSAKAA